jgi:ABC-type multidrug transport system fused ATPase/permease subunit
MIARALIGRPRILFFDEATSALDNRSQALVMQSLAGLRTTRIVVAHRLSTVENADHIFVLEAGHLVESGNFSELMAKDGLFRRLAQRQVL